MNLDTMSVILRGIEQGVTLPPVVMWMKARQLFSTCFAWNSRTVGLTLIRLFTA